MMTLGLIRGHCVTNMQHFLQFGSLAMLGNLLKLSSAAYTLSSSFSRMCVG